MIGELPEQMPYQEWLNSEYKDKQSCQSCHMPVIQEPVAITKVLGVSLARMPAVTSSWAETSSSSEC